MRRVAALVIVICLAVGLASCDWLIPDNGGGNGPQPGTVLFFDDFEEEADPEWRPESVAQGRWVVEDGAYTIENAPEDALMRTFAGETAWASYSLEVDMVFNIDDHNGPAYYSPHPAVFVRVLDANNMVGFFYVPNGASQLKMKTNGVWEVKAEGSTGDDKAVHIMITVDGSSYTAYVDSNLVAAFDDGSISHGYAGLQVDLSCRGGGCEYESFDNFSVQGL